MVTTNKERHWFDTSLLRTTALDKVVLNSRPSIEKQLRHGITELFENTELPTITMPLAAIAAELLKKPQDKDYVKRVLNNMGYKSQPSQRLRYPRLIEKSTDEGGLQITAIQVSFHTSYYEFNRADFITDESPGANSSPAEAQPEVNEELPF
jgi:hypothetical protein